MAIGLTGILEGLLCQLGVFLTYLLLTLAEVVADLFGLDTAKIVEAKNALASGCQG